MQVPIKSSNDYKPGDLIKRFKPQSHCVTDKFKSLVCDNCCQKSDHLKKCSKCLQMYYCDKDCQQKDWNCHKYECKVFRRSIWRKMPLEAPDRLLLRWWLCYDQDPNFSTQKHQAIDGTEFCFNDFKVEFYELAQDKQQMAGMAYYLSSFEKLGINIDRVKFANWYGLKDKTVMFDFSCSDNEIFRKIPIYAEAIGLAIVFQISRQSHSCIPNAIKVFNGTFTMQVRAVKPIANGEKITFALIDLHKSKAERQIQMRQMNMVECRCDKCCLNLDKGLDYEDYHALRTIQLYKWLSTRASKDERIAINKDYQIDRKLIDYMKAIYGDYYPSISWTLVRSFIHFAENSRLANKSKLKLLYEEIEPAIRITHGIDNPFYQSFKNFAANYILIE